jgi:hypothetical protein
MKRLLVVGTFALMVACLIAAYFTQSPFWQAFLINSSTSFLALGAGLLFVNVYLEGKARKGAVRSLLVLSHRAIVDFHNDLLTAAWSKFGRDQFGKIADEYVKAGGRPEALRSEVRQGFYEMMKSDKNLASRLVALEEALTELSRLAGWSLDPRLLEACLDARISISRLKATALDDSDKAKNDVTEHILDTEFHSSKALRLLKELAGLDDKE